MTFRNGAYYSYFPSSRIAFKYGELKGESVQMSNIRREVNNCSKHCTWRSFFIIEKELEE